MIRRECGEMTAEKAMGLLSWIQVNEDGTLNNPTWYGGIDKDLKEALKMAIDSLAFLKFDKSLQIEIDKVFEQIKEDIKKEYDDPYSYVVKQDVYHEVVDIIDYYLNGGKNDQN